MNDQKQHFIGHFLYFFPKLSLFQKITFKLS